MCAAGLVSQPMVTGAVSPPDGDRSAAAPTMPRSGATRWPQWSSRPTWPCSAVVGPESGSVSVPVSRRGCRPSRTSNGRWPARSGDLPAASGLTRGQASSGWRRLRLPHSSHTRRRIRPSRISRAKTGIRRTGRGPTRRRRTRPAGRPASGPPPTGGRPDTTGRSRHEDPDARAKRLGGPGVGRGATAAGGRSPGWPGGPSGLSRGPVSTRAQIRRRAGSASMAGQRRGRRPPCPGPGGHRAGRDSFTGLGKPKIPRLRIPVGPVGAGRRARRRHTQILSSGQQLGPVGRRAGPSADQELDRGGQADGDDGDPEHGHRQRRAAWPPR